MALPGIVATSSPYPSCALYPDVVQYVRSLEGGAGVFATRLSNALRSLGVESRLCVQGESCETLKDDCGRSGMLASKSAASTFVWRLYKKWYRTISRAGAGPFFPLRAPLPTTLNFPSEFSGIVHLHWIAKWLDVVSAFASIPTNMPVVISLHDMTLMSGGCFIYEGCDRFFEMCSPCPLLRSPFDLFVARKELNRKRDAYCSRAVHVVGNSNWTTAAAKRSAVFQAAASFQTIHPGIPEDFAPRGLRIARQALGINGGGLVLGFAAADITDANKQFSLFVETVSKVATDSTVTALVIGRGDLSMGHSNIHWRFLGPLKTSEMMSLAYSAMDLLVFPSRMETFGQVAAEASQCAVPVCAFDVGGLSDVVRHGETGMLAEGGDNQQFIANVKWLAEHPSIRRKFGEAASKYAAQKFRLDRFARDYMAVYRRAMCRTTIRPEQ